MRLSFIAAAVLFTAPAVAAPLALHPCHVEGSKAQMRCGAIQVPENRAAKDGPRISLEIVVLPARKQPAYEPIFFLSGGPGQDATFEAAGLAGAWPQADHDLVLVAMRGTGKASRLDCDLGGSDADPAGYVEPLFHEGRRYRDCARKLSKTADLTQYTTTAAMQDLEDVRKALGYRKINLYGGSYGTRAGIVYLHLFPGSVRAAILSGLSPISERGPLFHAQSAERSIEILFRQCAAEPACHKAFPDPKGDLDAILNALRRQPAQVTVKHPVTAKPVRLAFTASGFAEGLRIMLYDEAESRRVPLLLVKARNGDFTPFAQAAFAHGLDTKRALAMGLLLSVTCTEDVSRIRPEEVAPLTASSFIGDTRVRGQMAACSVWPTAPLPTSYAAPFKTNVPVLLVSGNLDPVTPPHWAADAQRSFPNSLSVVMPGAHVSDNDCTAAIMKKFLATASVKGLDTSCAARTRLPPFALK
jgi:pimeloyl-ACP methyl ester carboxylesterase